MGGCRLQPYYRYVVGLEACPYDRVSPYGYGRLPCCYIRVNLDSLIMDMQDLFIYTIHVCLLAG